jgi:hypothetical protein
VCKGEWTRKREEIEGERAKRAEEEEGTEEGKTEEQEKEPTEETIVTRGEDKTERDRDRARKRQREIELVRQPTERKSEKEMRSEGQQGGRV